MAVNVERSCTMLVHFDKAASASEIRAALEGNDALAKVQAMQKAIMMLLNGEPLPALFITIVRYVLPSEDHTVQKLLLLYLVSSPIGSLSSAFGCTVRQSGLQRFIAGEDRAVSQYGFLFPSCRRQ